MPVYTSPDRIPAPADTGEPPAASQLQDLAAVTQSVLARDRATSLRGVNEAKAAAQDARRVNFGTAVGTGSPITVATGHQGVPTLEFSLLAGVSALVTATFDVATTTVNGACTFSGRLNSINIDAPAPNYLSRAAVRRAPAAGDRATVTQTWSLGPTSYGRRIQAVVVKDNTNAAMTVDPTNCTLSYVLDRSGSA